MENNPIYNPIIISKVLSRINKDLNHQISNLQQDIKISKSLYQAQNRKDHFRDKMEKRIFGTKMKKRQIVSVKGNKCFYPCYEVQFIQIKFISFKVFVS